VAAIATGTAAAQLVALVAERQEHLSLLDTRIRFAKTAPEVLSTELPRLEREARTRLADFRSALEGDPAAARTFLGQVLAGPLKFPRGQSVPNRE